MNNKDDKLIEKIKDRFDKPAANKSSWRQIDILSQPIIAVDGIIEVEAEKYILIKRKFPPFKDYWAIPGGIVKYGESVEAALKREIKEETSLDVSIKKLVGVYSNPNRDPRGHVISICYLCKIEKGTPQAKSDAEELKIFTVDEIKNLKLAFDHLKMLKDAGVFD
ncbi:MAG: NUDIX domain-containing protein [Candidatus Odinarchaeia archaeon]